MSHVDDLYARVMAVAKFERLFRRAAALDVDKEDLKRYSDFVNEMLYHLLLRGEATAKANGRDFIEPIDLPITSGLQECIHEFERLDETIDLKPILDRLLAQPPSITLPAGKPRPAFRTPSAA